MKAPLSHLLCESFPNSEQVREEYMADYVQASPKKELLGIVMQDMMEKESGNIVAPDTTGMDFFFLMAFITEDMEMDFALIEQDFLKNCRTRLAEFHQVGWYGEMSFRTNNPHLAMYNNVLRLIYNGAKIGDDYCLE